MDRYSQSAAGTPINAGTALASEPSESWSGPLDRDGDVVDIEEAVLVLRRDETIDDGLEPPVVRRERCLHTDPPRSDGTNCQQRLSGGGSIRAIEAVCVPRVSACNS